MRTVISSMIKSSSALSAAEVGSLESHVNKGVGGDSKDPGERCKEELRVTVGVVAR